MVVQRISFNIWEEKVPILVSKMILKASWRKLCSWDYVWRRIWRTIDIKEDINILFIRYVYGVRVWRQSLQILLRAVLYFISILETFIHGIRYIRYVRWWVSYTQLRTILDFIEHLLLMYNCTYTHETTQYFI